MKAFIKMFEEVMVAIAFAEEGVAVSFLQQKYNPDKELGVQTWELT